MRWFTVSISYFYCWVSRTKADWGKRKEWCILYFDFPSAGQTIMVGKAGLSWSHSSRSQRGVSGRVQLVDTKVPGPMLPTFRVGLPTSSNTVYKLPHGHVYLRTLETVSSSHYLSAPQTTFKPWIVKCFWLDGAILEGKWNAFEEIPRLRNHFKARLWWLVYKPSSLEGDLRGLPWVPGRLRISSKLSASLGFRMKSRFKANIWTWVKDAFNPSETAI